MKDEKVTDYARVKVAALQQLARGGDREAIRELARRGVAEVAPVDVTALDYAALRALVLAWRDGTMPADREQSFALALQAQAELEVRYRVDSRRWDGQTPEPQPPPLPPWLWPRGERCIGWQRPNSSKLYPSDTDIQRAQFNAMAKAGK